MMLIMYALWDEKVNHVNEYKFKIIYQVLLNNSMFLVIVLDTTNNLKTGWHCTL